MADKATWQEINSASFTGKLKTHFAEYKAKQDAANTARKAMESDLVAALTAANMVPSGATPKFSYRFGKISVTMDTAAKAATSSAKGIDLS